MATEKPDKRDALLDAAERLFVEKGYSAVGTREIADAAGVNLAMIRYYFNSKGQLFIDVVRRMMGRGAGANARAVLENVPNDADEAAFAICRFIRLFLGHLLQSTQPQACRLMYREVLSDNQSEPELYEALVSSVTAEFTIPLERALANVLAMLAPEATASENELAARSILGQCAFYFTHRAFVERQCSECLSEPSLVNELARHVARFSLRGVGCDDEVIDRALERAAAEASPTYERGLTAESVSSA